MNPTTPLDPALEDLLRTMPKAELHIHIEGSLEPELIFELARRNGVAIAYPDVESLRAAYAFSDLQSFLDIYYAGASVLLTEQDFFDMAWAYLERAKADKVMRAEIFFDPQTHTDRGVPMASVIGGLARACRAAKTGLGINAALILCFLRHLSEDAAFATLTDALRNVPGVGAFYAGENGNTSTGDTVFMRGFDASSSIYVDGVRDLGAISRDVFNTEQVEVIEGPSGSDFGRSAPTGSINMVTKQPQLDNFVDGSLTAGSASYKRATVDLNRALGNNGTALRLNAMVQDAGVPGRHGVEDNRWGIAPSLALGLGTPTRLHLNYLHMDQDNVPDGGVSTIGLPGYSAPDDPAYSGYRDFLNEAPRADSRNFYGTRSDKDKVKADMLTVRFEHDFAKDQRLSNTLRWGKTRQDYLLTAIMGQGYAADGTPGARLLDTPDPSDPSTWSIARLINVRDQSNKILTNQTNFSTSFAIGKMRHDLSAGLELTREEQTSHTLATSGVVPERVSVYQPDANVSLPDYERTGAHNDGKTDTAAIYAFDTVWLNDSVQLNGGLRLDRYRTRYTAHADDGTSNHLSKSGTLTNWKLGALYKFVPSASVYANYAISQQPPGGANFTLVAEDVTRDAQNRPSMDPQKAKTAELGVKWEAAGGNLLLSGAVFRTEITNEVVSNPDGTVDQTGKKRVQGLTLGAVGRITPRWGVVGGYTLQSAKVTSGTNVSSDDSTGMPYTPRSAFSLWSTYRLTPKLTLGGGAVYAGGLKRGTDGAVGTPNSTQSYWVANAMVGYQINRHADLQLNVYNLFDKDYAAAINKSGYRYFPGAERSARLTLNVRF